ncbi:MAG: DUF2442 domain-containing protein [Leptospiraceae bacterium]|nr:DUF2442 domain-containing protein [Leptospiraceae bacterium]MCP5496778.1 DUF2442 domain-containing protein [Leptospiraceae bacterium]
MLVDIVYVKPRKKSLLYLKFENGITGVINLEKMITYEGVFEPLKEWNYFKLVRVNQELGTVCWPNKVDLDPVVLYKEILNKKEQKVLRQVQGVVG